MDDWDEEDFEPTAPNLKMEQSESKWADEDVEEEDVKESWEDEEPAQAPKPQPVAGKTAPKTAKKAAGKKGKQAEAKKIEVTNEALRDPVEETLRQQRPVEEADCNSTVELFAKKIDERSLDNFIPKSESDFMEYAQLLSRKIRSYEGSYYYIHLLKAVLRHSTTSLKAADARELASSITATANEKQKAEKEANASKKKQGAKKKVAKKRMVSLSDNLRTTPTSFTPVRNDPLQLI